ATNQTRLNDVPTSEAKLEPGDIIIVGSTSVMFDGEDVEVDEPAADVGSTVRIAVIAKSANLHAGNRTPPIGGSFAFGAKRNRKWMFIGIIIGICVFAIAAFTWVLYVILHA
ncbi:MAG: hypothetical protein JXN60_08025, partial [Lentisphaerae bacterium]|nr:hypothetical protein [Lentisphaerota bacterium]